MNLTQTFNLISIFLLLAILSRHEAQSSDYANHSVVKQPSSWKSISAPISLAFVFDQTGSMFDDLVQVRAGAARILRNTITNGENAVQNYILVPFRDPGLNPDCTSTISVVAGTNDFHTKENEVGPAFQTTDPEIFLQALNNIIVLGGKDCPEMSITAIKHALQLCRPGSVVYVFTDAEAKDYRELPDVIRLIKEKNVRVNFVLTGSCDLASAHELLAPQTYETIATVSSGQVVNLNKSEVNKIWKFVEISINLNRRNIFSADKLTGGAHAYVVEMYEHIDQVIVTATGDGVTLSVEDNEGRLVYPQDHSVEEVIKFPSIVSILVKNPRPGNWSVNVKSKERHSLRVEGISTRWYRIQGEHKVVVIAGKDECATNLHNCTSNEICQNLPNGFTCVKMCDDGFEKTKDGKCNDVDECSRYAKVCGELKCVNKPGTYRCENMCETGMRLVGGTCEDIDECVENSRICGDRRECVNTRGSYRCRTKCGEGYMRRGSVCIDVDECMKYPDICDDRECINIRGSYRCDNRCPYGYQRTAGTCRDIDECKEYSQICGKHECTNTKGGYICEIQCPAGYQRRKPEVRCEDINECAQNPTVCGDRDCINTRGSYRCMTKCQNGYQRRSDGVCADVNECAQNPQLCGDGECTNTLGSYRCVTRCRNGYQNGENGVCSDIDECAENAQVCGADRQCVNAPGSYRCEVTCPRGYHKATTGDCTDIDECTRYSQICGDRDCVNTRGSYLCETKRCPTGYERREQHDTCTDIDECRTQPRKCQFDCVNSPGSFQCLCPRGSRLASDQVTCIRITNCPSHGYGRCQYTCNADTGKCECPPGYRLHWDQLSCLDVNECLAGQHACGTRECFNTLGKYHCLNISCPTGYSLSRDGYCIKQCTGHNSRDCPGQYSSVRHSAVSIPCQLPLNTDFMQLQPHVPFTNTQQPCYCTVYFYPLYGDKKDLFGLYQVGGAGRLYNKVVFDSPGFYELRVFSDYLNGYGAIVSRTTYRVFIDVSSYTF